MSPDAHYSGDRRLSPCRHSVAASYVTTASEHTAINSPRISSLDRHSNVVVKEGSSGIDFLFMRNWAQMVKTQASEPRMESELYVFFYNVLSSVEHLVSGNPAEEYKLANTPDVISAIAALIRYQAESMHDRATLLLSQLALSHWEIAVAITKEPGLIQRLTELLTHGSKNARDSAGLLVNNLAGSGGDEAVLLLSNSSQLIQRLVMMLDSDDSLELQRITSTFNHLSRSPRSARVLSKTKAQEALVRLLSQTRFCQEESWMGLATMALSNMQSREDGVYFSANQDTLPHLVEFLRCAMDQIKLNGIYFRVYDVMYTLAHVSHNPINHAVLADCGLIEALCHIVTEWTPGKYVWKFSAQNVDTHPVLERATDALYNLCESEQCRIIMQGLSFEGVCERLIRTEDAIVKEYAAKVLWRLRDRQIIVLGIQQIIANVNNVRTISGRYDWTESERVMRLNAVLQLNDGRLGQQVAESVRWMKDGLQFDRMERIRHLMLGTQTSSTRMVFKDWGLIAKRNSKIQWRYKMLQRIHKATLMRECFGSWFNLARNEMGNRRKIGNIVARWSHRELLPAFNAWQDHVKTRRKQRNICTRVVRRWENQRYALPFLAWQEFTTTEKRLRQSLTRIVRRWTHMALAPAFLKWFEWSKEQTRMEYVCDKIIKRWTHMTIAPSFDRWREMSDREAKLKRICSKILGRWTHMALAPAFLQWFEWSKEQTRMEYVCDKIIKRWTHMTIAPSFDRWREMSDREAKLKRICSRIISRWSRLSLFRCLHTWRMSSRDEKVLLSKYVKSLCRRTRLTLASCFDAWRRSSSLRQHMQPRIRLLLVKWNQSWLSGMFSRWLEHMKLMRHFDMLALLTSIQSADSTTLPHRESTPSKLKLTSLQRWHLACTRDSRRRLEVLVAGKDRSLARASGDHNLLSGFLFWKASSCRHRLEAECKIHSQQAESLRCRRDKFREHLNSYLGSRTRLGLEESFFMWHREHISLLAAKLKHTLDQQNIEDADTVFMPPATSAIDIRRRSVVAQRSAPPPMGGSSPPMDCNVRDEDLIMFELEEDLTAFENRHSGRVQSSPPSVDYSDKQQEEWEFSSMQSRYTLSSSTVDRLRTTLGIISRGSAN